MTIFWSVAAHIFYAIIIMYIVMCAFIILIACIATGFYVHDTIKGFYESRKNKVST